MLAIFLLTGTTQIQMSGLQDFAISYDTECCPVMHASMNLVVIGSDNDLASD